MSKTVGLSRWARIRVVGVSAVLVLLLAAIAYRAYGLQIEKRDHYRDLARRQHVASVEVPAPRGAIYDATGAELAVTADIDSVYANPREIHDFSGTADKLAAILDLNPATIEARLDAPRYFVWIDRHISAEKARMLREAQLRGVYLTQEPRRFYPSKELAAHILGFAGIDGRGLAGIELTLDDVITGRRARSAALRDATGKLMFADEVVEPKPGAAVTLTIDRFIQHTAERALAAAIDEHQAKAGVAVVMEVGTGNVLALANWPNFDPNKPIDALAPGARNRAISHVYEIGSIMKIFSVAAALDAGVVEPDTMIDVQWGRLRIGSKIIRDTYGDRELDVAGVIKRSSNVGAVKIAQMLGRERLHDKLSDLGFGRPTEIEMPGEQGGVLRDADRWSDIGLATHAYGYGLSVTPLQVAAAMTAVANGGIYHAPRLIDEVRTSDGEVIYTSETEGRRVLSEQTALALRPMMASVFDRGRFSGTARSLDLGGMTAGGKTGTAHKLDPDTGTYADDLYLSSFAGFAPLDDPRVVVLVLIDEPHGEHHYGGSVAGPVWLDITKTTLHYLGVPVADEPGKDDESLAAVGQPDSGQGDSVGMAGDPNGDDDDGSPGGDAGQPGEGAPAMLAESDGDAAQIPDFAGLGMARALELAASRGIAVEMVGSGRAVEQFPPAGTMVTTGRCRIVFANESRQAPRSL